MSVASTPAAITRDDDRVIDRPGRQGKWRTRLAYVLLIGYAILMFIPFAWTVITSFKTLPDSVSLTIIPQPFTLDAYEYVFRELRAIRSRRCSGTASSSRWS